MTNLLYFTLINIHFKNQNHSTHNLLVIILLCYDLFMFIFLASSFIITALYSLNLFYFINITIT